MGFGSLLGKGLKLASKVGKIPGIGMIPMVGNIASGLSVASAAYGGYKALTSGGGSKPIVGTLPPGGLPALPGMGGAGTAMVAAGQTGGFGLPRGVGGKLQLPWNDPSIPAYLKQFSLDDSFLRQSVRAPRGYVVIRDADGRPFAVLKTMAKQFKLWKAKPKPPISVRDWHHLRGAGRVVDKLQDMEKVAKKIANWKSPRHAAPVASKKRK